MAKIRTTISMDAEVYKKLTDMSQKGERNISQQLSYLIKKDKGVDKEG